MACPMLHRGVKNAAPQQTPRRIAADPSDGKAHPLRWKSSPPSDGKAHRSQKTPPMEKLNNAQHNRSLHCGANHSAYCESNVPHVTPLRWKSSPQAGRGQRTADALLHLLRHQVGCCLPHVIVEVRALLIDGLGLREVQQLGDTAACALAAEWVWLGGIDAGSASAHLCQRVIWVWHEVSRGR